MVTDTTSSGVTHKSIRNGAQKPKSIPQPPESESGSDVDDTEGWGSKKSAYYSSNAAQLESDDEEANEMEEQEARRLQAKMRTHMSESDFGLDRLSFESDRRQEAEYVFVFLSLYVSAKAYTFLIFPSSSIFLDDVHTYTPVAVPSQDRASLIRHLEKTNPESLALAFEWEDVVQATLDSEKKIAQSVNLYILLFMSKKIYQVGTRWEQGHWDVAPISR